MRLVLDANVIVAAMRSPSGASAALLRAVRRGEITLLANVALALEYEAVCLQPSHILASGLTEHEATLFVAMNTAEFFAERRARADFDAFDRLLSRKGGQAPKPDDTIG